MSPEVAAEAFDPFFTTKPLGQGTGLGLSMVYGFAKQSEGHARIYSEPGRSTTIEFDLPRPRGAVQPETVAAGLTESHRAERGDTVRVVEDEPVVRGLIVGVLGDLGYTALLREPGRIDLLISDVGLPPRCTLEAPVSATLAPTGSADPLPGRPAATSATAPSSTAPSAERRASPGPGP